MTPHGGTSRSKLREGESKGISNGRVALRSSTWNPSQVNLLEVCFGNPRTPKKALQKHFHFQKLAKPVPGVHGKRGLERVGRKGWQRVGERLAKGWRRAGEGLAKGWRRVGKGLAGFLAPSNFAIPEAPV